MPRRSALNFSVGLMACLTVLVLASGVAVNRCSAASDSTRFNRSLCSRWIEGLPVGLRRSPPGQRTCSGSFQLGAGELLV